MRKYGRYDRSSARRERIILITSAAFVLAALTLTGVYMSRNSEEDMDDGYTMDFAALENSTKDKLEEIADSNTGNTSNANVNNVNLEDDLDYMPMEQETDAEDAEEAGSNMVEIAREAEPVAEAENIIAEEAPAVEEAQIQLSFANEILRPVEGTTLIPYSMDKSVYFTTLDQYKYNPAMIIEAEEGENVAACADGRVTDIYEDAVLGEVLVLELGDGYSAVYGQLTDIQVSVDDYVNAGEIIASVGAPTKYYSLEGSNLYFRLDSDGTAVNPEDFF
ncbi:MAG: M23 family metallopeptidase [Lachnospiraceae bacterium]|nr:M23 family metallopeptidase [Lachnospiraceae bacterium]